MTSFFSISAYGSGMNASQSATDMDWSKAPLPPPGERALIQRLNLTGLVIRDRTGKWRDYYSNEELKDMREVVLRFESGVPNRAL